MPLRAQSDDIRLIYSDLCASLTPSAFNFVLNIA